MDQSNTILVIDHFNSTIKQNLNKTLNSCNEVEHIFVSIDEIESLEYNFNPLIIFILLDNCQLGQFDSYKLENLRIKFWRSPIISIINPNTCSCNNNMYCQKISWHFITSTICCQGIKLLIQWYLNYNAKSRDINVEFSLKERSLIDLFIGESTSANEVKTKILTIASQEVTVLIQGETGTGKELSAKLIHYLSKRSKGPFISINCGAIPSTLFENELFGHKKGAYTGADKSETGLIHAANHGTLFLDEIESLPLSSQVKLLRFLEERKYRPLGQPDLNNSDVRIIVASNCDLEELVDCGKFRADLFYRISVVNISLSPLRERKEDIPLLSQHFIEKFSKLHSKNIKGIRPNAILSLVNYSWHGNVRELENVIQEAVILCSDSWIELANLNFKKLGTEGLVLSSFQEAKNKTVNSFEREYLNAILNSFNGNVSKAAAFAGKNRREFYRLITKHNINLDNYRVSEFTVKF